MKCPGPPCEHTCEHNHCDMCGVPMSIGSIAEKIAEFIRNFHRQPTQEEMSNGVCGDCYERVLAFDRSLPRQYG